MGLAEALKAKPCPFIQDHIFPQKEVPCPHIKTCFTLQALLRHPLGFLWASLSYFIQRSHVDKQQSCEGHTHKLYTEESEWHSLGKGKFKGFIQRSNITEFLYWEGHSDGSLKDSS